MLTQPARLASVKRWLDWRRLVSGGKAIPWLVLLLSLGTTMVAGHFARQYVDDSNRRNFEARAAELTQKISARLDAYNHVLLGVTGLFSASERVTPQEWHAYLRKLQLSSNFAGMTGVGYIQHVRAADLPAHVAQVRADGSSQYAIHPAGARAEYDSIVYPMAPHGDPFSSPGFDMRTLPEQAVAMESARSSGAPAITGKINFMRAVDQKAEPGFLMFFPVYRNDMSGVPTEKARDFLMGYVYCRIDMADLLADVFPLQRPQLEMQIHDKDAGPDSLLLSINGEERQANDYRPAFVAHNIMPVNDRFWTIRYFSSAYTDAVTETYLYRMIFLGGTLISALFFWVAWSLSTSHKRATTLARQMTAESHEMALKMSHLAQHDYLTDLPNRALLDDRLGRAVAHASRYKRRLAVLFIDLDRFKNVNDSLGHMVGDKLLQQLARKLLRQLRQPDTLSRQGGDEFVVLLSEIKDHSDVEAVARKLLAAGSQPFMIDGHEIQLSLSIGIAVFPEHGRHMASLMKRADVAMYHAKKLGRNNYQFYTPALGASTDERIDIENKLRHAIRNNELRLHFQPQVDYGQGRIVGAEALVRWQRSANELMAPADFISVAEECGLIVEIDKWVLTETCRQLCSWQAAGLPVVPVSINLSMINFNHDDFFSHVKRLLRETGVDPQYLEVELTETVLTKDVELVKQTLTGLKKLGLSIAIDDFGTGYSSLSYLTQFPIDTLKVDQVFVKNIASNSSGAAITQAIISMAKSLSQRVVAEGVETTEQAQILHGYHCDAMQGYLFSQPVDAETFAAMLAADEHPVALRIVG